MKKTIKQIFLILVIMSSFLLPIMTYIQPASAVSIGVGLSRSAETVEVGGDFSVIVNISEPILVENYQIDLTFNSSEVTYTGFSDLTNADTAGDNATSGRVRVTTFGGSATTSSLVKFNFKANVPSDETRFSIDYAEVLAQEPPTGASTSVKITPPKSGNADLASLAVDQGTLNPAFNPGTLNYSMQVGMGVNSVNVTAAAADPKAIAVNVSGHNSLKDGTNTIRIVVTAENGSTKTYTISATRLGPTPTPAPTPTPEPTPTPLPSVDINGGKFTLIELPEDVEVPTGFYEAAIELNGEMVTAYKSRHGGLVLLYLSNEGPESGFYFYDTDTGEFFRFAQLTVPGAVFTRIRPDESVVVPNGFAEARITIDGESFDCWKPYNENGEATAESGIYLLYLLNDRGEKGFYYFQNSTRLIYPYTAVPHDAEPTPVPTPTPAPTPTPVPVVETNYSQTANPYFVVTIILASIIVLLSGVMAWMLIRRRSASSDHGSSDGDGFEESIRSNNETSFIKPPKIRRVGTPPVSEDDDFEE